MMTRRALGWGPRCGAGPRSVGHRLLVRCTRQYRHVSSGVASYGALGNVPPQLPTILFLVHYGVNLTDNYRYPNIVYSLRDQLVQMSTTHSSFDK